MKRTRLKGAQGFTLLELLMVVIIIAILASIALPQYLKTAERSRGSEALQMLGTLRSAELRYQAGSPTNVFTAALADLDTTIPAASALFGYSVNAALTHGLAARSIVGGFTIGINLLNGNICSTSPAATNTYGLPFVAGATCP